MTYHAKALAHQRRADDYRRLAFGETPDAGHAVNKQDEEITLNMGEMRAQMESNGDYRLVHSHAKAQPNANAEAALRKLKLFKKTPEALASCLEHARGEQRALALLFQRDPKSLKRLLVSLL